MFELPNDIYNRRYPTTSKQEVEVPFNARNSFSDARGGHAQRDHAL